MDVQDNLYLRCNARVNRVLFDDNNKAVGVAYVPSRNRGNQGQLLETIVSRTVLQMSNVKRLMIRTGQSPEDGRSVLWYPRHPPDP